jgi:hypothetical protein
MTTKEESLAARLFAIQDRAKAIAWPNVIVDGGSRKSGVNPPHSTKSCEVPDGKGWTSQIGLAILSCPEKRNPTWSPAIYSRVLT